MKILLLLLNGISLITYIFASYSDSHSTSYVILFINLKILARYFFLKLYFICDEGILLYIC